MGDEYEYSAADIAQYERIVADLEKQLALYRAIRVFVNGRYESLGTLEKAAVQAETERCARLAEAWKQFVVGDACSVLMKRLCDQIAAEIREGEKF